MTRFELERDVHHQLHRLPTPSAPPTLLPRVLAAAHAWRARPWYARDWRTWPLTGQLAFTAALVTLLIGGTLGWPAAVSMAAPHLEPFTPAVHAASDHLAAWQGSAASAFGVGSALWRALVQPLAPFAFVLVALMCAACAACVIALNRVAAERSLRP